MPTIEHKYIAIAPIGDPMADIILAYSDHAEVTLGRSRPHRSFEKPYATFHPPVRCVKPDRFLGAVEGPTKTASVSRMRFTGIDIYGRGDVRFVTLPFTVPLGPSGLWWELSRNVMVQAEFLHGEYDYDNTLHTTLAKDLTAEQARLAWPTLRRIAIEPADVVIDRIEVHRKPDSPGGSWERIATFPLQPAT